MELNLDSDRTVVGIEKLEYSSSVFPGGEINFRIISKEGAEKVVILTRINNSHKMMELFMAVDALRNMGTKEITLILSYMPYGRQDRVCNPGEAASLKVFAKLINSQKFDKVVTVHPHSLAIENLFDNLHIVDNKLFVELALEKVYGEKVPMKDLIILSPDAGALKNTYKLATDLKFGDISVAQKIRNLGTGEILRTEVDKEDYEGKDIWIVDDICDGGRTFIEIHKSIVDKNIGKVYAVFTHGIFSKGLEPLSMFDKIFTTDSFRSKEGFEDPENLLEVFQMGGNS